ncbi:Nitrogen permease regulator 3 [Talaromyces atroroseus]|uniref:Nitrogen permease regulator 3 n=1 Tax=Talaromyces atroroseus TaxID=1441469 RepID=A0A225ANQ1_TALAT|nr:Nitrogen permease regulator 3 [Talaromyces atroroseus]OKL58918.1 Nitrogen permease regulator 3 [Talaromyces atroroseus]
MSSMQGKVFAVTGAASGIGYAVALHLAKLGARLSITDRSEESLEKTAKELETLTGTDNILSRAANICDRTAVEQWEPIWNVTDDDWEFAQNVNVRGALNLVRAELKYMVDAVSRKEIETGSIVLFGSNSSVTGAPNLSAYTTSKHAVLGLMRSAALDAAPYNIRVNAVCPGPIDTPMLRNAVPESALETLTGFIPLKRLGTAKEVAGLVAYLLDEHSGFCTGGVHIIDGVQSRAGPRCVFHTPANPDLEKLVSPSLRRGRGANDPGSDEESQSSSDEEDEEPIGLSNSGAGGGGSSAGGRPSNANVDDSNSTTASSAGGDSQRPPSFNSGKTRRRVVNSDLEESSELTALGSSSAVLDSVFGLPSDVWEKLLSPTRAWHKRRFEIGINDLAFVGWPVFVREDGYWRKKSKRRKRKKSRGDKGHDNKESRNAEEVVESDHGTKRASATSDNDSTLDGVTSGEGANADIVSQEEYDDDANEQDTGSPEADKDTMSMFNVVFVMSPPVLEYSIHLKEMYEHVIKKFSKALKYEQDRSDYVWKEAQRILQIKEQTRERGISAESLHDELVSKSSLAAAIHSVFDKISKSDIAFVSLKSRSADFQIPPTTSIAELPSSNESSLAGMWLTTANSVTTEHSTGMEAPNQVLAKNFALLLLESEASILEALKGSELAPALSHYIRCSRPNKSFAQISALSGIPLDTIHDLAQHLVYWRRARAIPPLHQRDTYTVSPNCDLSQLKRATQAYATAFPTLPSLPKMLSALSGTPRPYATFIPSKDHKETYFSILAWLLRGGWVTQLRSFSRVKVTPEIKFAVERKMRKEQIEKYIASGGQTSSSSSSSGKPRADNPGDNGDGDDDDDYDDLASTSSGNLVNHSQATDEQDTPTGPRGGWDEDQFHLTDSYLDNNSHLNMSSMILFPHRASPLESRWLDEIMSRFPDPAVVGRRNNNNNNTNGPNEGDDSTATDSLQKHWPQFVKYFNGNDALEKIAVCEGMRRKAVWQLLQRLGLSQSAAGFELDPRERVLVTVRHW